MLDFDDKLASISAFAKNINPKPLSGLSGYYIDSILYTKNDILSKLGHGEFNYKQYIFIKNGSGDIETVDTLPTGANIYPYAANVEDSILMTNLGGLGTPVPIPAPAPSVGDIGQMPLDIVGERPLTNVGQKPLDYLGQIPVPMPAEVNNVGQTPVPAEVINVGQTPVPAEATNNQIPPHPEILSWRDRDFLNRASEESIVDVNLLYNLQLMAMQGYTINNPGYNNLNTSYKDIIGHDYYPYYPDTSLQSSFNLQSTIDDYAKLLNTSLYTTEPLLQQTRFNKINTFSKAKKAALAQNTNGGKGPPRHHNIDLWNEKLNTIILPNINNIPANIKAQAFVPQPLSVEIYKHTYACLESIHQLERMGLALDQATVVRFLNTFKELTGIDYYPDYYLQLEPPPEEIYYVNEIMKLDKITPNLSSTSSGVYSRYIEIINGLTASKKEHIANYILQPPGNRNTLYATLVVIVAT